eukprot:gene5757-11632_t
MYLQWNLFCSVILWVLFKHFSSSSKWAVSFATIRPRFRFCNFTVQSWLRQSTKPDYILIFVNSHWDSQRKRRIQIPSVQNSADNHMSRLHTISDTERLRRRIAREFPVEYSSGIIRIIEIAKDYGPSTKFVGVLMSLNMFDVDYWVIGDDDLIYKNHLLSTYSNHYIKNPPSAQHGPVTTFFDREIFVLQIPSLQVKTETTTVYHVQGADTYVIPDVLLRRQNHLGLLITYGKYTLLLEYLFRQCPNSYINDDYIVSYALTVSNITISSLWEGNVMYTATADSDGPSELHSEIDIYSKFPGNDIRHCLMYDNDNLTALWHNSNKPL